MSETGAPEGGEAPEVSQGLVGLMGAFDALKDAVGYGGQDSAELAQIEHFVQEIEAENIKLRQHAEDAIIVSC